MSHAVEVVVSTFYGAIDGHDLRAGHAYDLLHVGAIMLVAICAMFLADVKGLAEVACANGPTGLRPCFCCRKIMSFTSYDRLGAVDGGVPLDELDPNKWKRHTNKSF